MMDIVARIVRRSVFLVVLTAALTMAVRAARADWATYQGDAGHTGYVPGRSNFSHPRVLWQTALGANRLKGLAIGDGTVFITQASSLSDSPKIHALDQATGSSLWSRSAEMFLISAPAYLNGLVYFQTDGHSALGGNFLNAYAARSGETIFNAGPFCSPSFGLPALALGSVPLRHRRELRRRA